MIRRLFPPHADYGIIYKLKRRVVSQIGVVLRYRPYMTIALVSMILASASCEIAMARSADPHSATSQFFINHTDNPALDFREEAPDASGYCVFGKVIVGMDVVDKIADVETTTRLGFNDVPVDPVVIVKLYLSN
jgi:cyclophilin family peptidyl-prolyl cis-trans isomerase